MKVPQRFHSLDALRGIAALAVVLAHWRLWMLDGHYRYPAGFELSSLPGYSVLFFFYEVGWHAVTLFFCLSGFIFFSLYRDTVGSGRVTATQFWLARFSRLYPLHLAALLLVATGQALFKPMQGSAFVFAINDLPNFVKHLLVIPLWDRQRNHTFNGPVWTLAVEAFLYATFYLAARWATLRPGGVLLMLILASQITETYSYDMGQGMSAFYMGGLAFIAFERAQSPEWERALRLLLAALWPFTIYYVWSGGDMANSRVWWLRDGYPVYILFPATVLYFALREAREGALGRSFAWLGEISYSSYLLHFPLMLFIAILLKRAGIPFTIALSPTALVCFLLLLVVLSLGSYRFFEKPVQDWLRGQWRRRRTEPPADSVIAPA